MTRRLLMLMAALLLIVQLLLVVLYAVVYRPPREASAASRVARLVEEVHRVEWAVADFRARFDNGRIAGSSESGQPVHVDPPGELRLMPMLEHMALRLPVPPIDESGRASVLADILAAWQATRQAVGNDFLNDRRCGTTSPGHFESARALAATMGKVEKRLDNVLRTLEILRSRLDPVGDGRD